VKLNLAFFRIWNNIGVCYHILGEYKRALEYYKKASEIEYEDTFPLINSGYCFENLGRFDEAIEMYRSTLKIDSNNSNALASLIRLGVGL
jgi:tetratricopeptide (TPR) repeat protein